jgi:hypothetical protein
LQQIFYLDKNAVTKNKAGSYCNGFAPLKPLGADSTPQKLRFKRAVMT